MVQIEGSYKIARNENFGEYLKSLGSEMTEDLVARLNASKSVLKVKLDGDKCTLITNASDGSENCLSFTFGVSFVDEIVQGVNLKTTPTFDGTSINLKSETDDGRGGNRRYEFSDTGVTIYYSTNGSNETARRIYTRV